MTTSSIVPFTTATAVTRVAKNSDTWKAILIQDYCVGAVPNGGYVASVMAEAVSRHLASLGLRQEIISAQFQYINRTQVGDAVIVIDEVKRGRATSTFHATLLQDGGKATTTTTHKRTRKCVGAYFVCAATSQQGLTLATDWKLLPPPAPVDLQQLASGTEPNWAMGSSRIQISHLASLGFVRAVEAAFESYYPRTPGRKGLEDAWIRLSSGERFTNATLPLVADAKPYVVEGWRPSPSESEGSRDAGDQAKKRPFPRDETFWYPTLVMNLDIKKSLPSEGEEWLFLRTEAKKIDNGRLDLQVTILDQYGDLVALASHVNMVLSSDRNTGKSSSKTKEKL